MGGDSSSGGHPWKNLEGSLIGTILYGLLVIGAVVSLVITIRNKYPKKKAASISFHSVLILFSAIRFVWFLARMPFSTLNDVLVTGLNRAGFLFFFTNFTLIIYFWAEQYVSYVSDMLRWKKYLPWAKRAFVLFNLITYTVLIALFILWWRIDQPKNLWEQSGLYEGQIYSVIALTGAAQLIMMATGIALYIRQMEVEWYDSTEGREMRKIIFSMILFCVCCLLRIFIWAYRPITGRFLNELVFYSLAYWVPEILVSLVQIWIVQTSGDREAADNSLIEGMHKQAHGTISQPLLA